MSLKVSPPIFKFQNNQPGMLKVGQLPPNAAATWEDIKNEIKPSTKLRFARWFNSYERQPDVQRDRIVGAARAAIKQVINNQTAIDTSDAGRKVLKKITKRMRQFDSKYPHRSTPLTPQSIEEGEGDRSALLGRYEACLAKRDQYLYEKKISSAVMKNQMKPAQTVEAWQKFMETLLLVIIPQNGTVANLRADIVQKLQAASVMPPAKSKFYNEWNSARQAIFNEMAELVRKNSSMTPEAFLAEIQEYVRNNFTRNHSQLLGTMSPELWSICSEVKAARTERDRLAAQILVEGVLGAPATAYLSSSQYSYQLEDMAKTYSEFVEQTTRYEEDIMNRLSVPALRQERKEASLKTALRENLFCSETSKEVAASAVVSGLTTVVTSGLFTLENSGLSKGIGLSTTFVGTTLAVTALIKTIRWLLDTEDEI